MLIDVFTDRYEHDGTAEKKDAHARGLWHRAFSALMVSPAARTVTLQKKALGRAGFDRPDYADFSVGGHYEAGEDIPAGVREAREELGLRTLEYGDFVPLGVRQTAVTLGPDGIEREFQHWHLLPYDAPLDTIPLDDAVPGHDRCHLTTLVDTTTSGTCRPVTHCDRQADHLLAVGMGPGAPIPQRFHGPEQCSYSVESPDRLRVGFPVIGGRPLGFGAAIKQRGSG
ncbi:MAG TPA: NUDIX domain-containing protein [Trebonia sp.]|nr:NUDIX domain-containing protein [Trebonia sp.]